MATDHLGLIDRTFNPYQLLKYMWQSTTTKTWLVGHNNCKYWVNGNECLQALPEERRGTQLGFRHTFSALLLLWTSAKDMLFHVGGGGGSGGIDGSICVWFFGGILFIFLQYFFIGQHILRIVPMNAFSLTPIILIKWFRIECSLVLFRK